MQLLTDEIRQRLPQIHGQEAEADPRVFARFFIPGTSLSWYVTEGEPDGEDFRFFGFVSGPDQFGFFRLSELQAAQSLSGQAVERDLAFREGRLTEVVPAPE